MSRNRETRTHYFKQLSIIGLPLIFTILTFVSPFSERFWAKFGQEFGRIFRLPRRPLLNLQPEDLLELLHVVRDKGDGQASRMGRDQEIHVPYRSAVSPQMRADLTIVRRCATFERDDLEGRQELIENSVVLLRLDLATCALIEKGEHVLLYGLQAQARATSHRPLVTKHAAKAMMSSLQKRQNSFASFWPAIGPITHGRREPKNIFTRIYSSLMTSR